MSDDRTWGVLTSQADEDALEVTLQTTPNITTQTSHLERFIGRTRQVALGSLEVVTKSGLDGIHAARLRP